MLIGWKKFCFVSFILIFIFGSILDKTISKNVLKVENLRVEYKKDPIGIDITKPRMSWELRSEFRNTVQTSYILRCASSVDALHKGADLLWTNKETSDQSVHVVYRGPDLESRQRVYWQVKITDNHGHESEWSEPGFWEMGLLDQSDWQAQWIEADILEDETKSQPAQYLRKEFTLAKQLKSARLYITSHGLYEAWINGRRAGEQVFTPGWTSYNKRIQYQCYEITDLLNTGENAIGAILGDGWYRGYLGWKDRRNVYGTKLALLAQLEVTYQDGSKEVVKSDQSWKATNKGPILASDIYMGEKYDARKKLVGWKEAGYDESLWNKVSIRNFPKDNLIASYGPSVKIVEEIIPVEIIPKDENRFIFDMGQNMVGWIRLKLRAKAGTEITLRHAEVLDKSGNLYTDNLRSAKQTVTYICKGGDEEVFEPHFTFQGFRFVEISGYPGVPDPEMLTGRVIHSNMQVTGSFSCSDSLINQLQHNILWGLKGNFLDVPTDCPQRDERLGWTGDAQVFAPTACFNVDAASFYTKWLKDLALDQDDQGKVNDVVPDVLKGGGGHTGWADASIVIPWTVYLNYGDTRILVNQYDSMKAWVRYMQEKAGDDFIWDGDWHYGDWLSFDDDHPAYMGAYTETDLIATAYFAYSTTLLSRIAKVLNQSEEAAQYGVLADKIRKAFQNEFITPNGRLVSNTQTAYTLALAFDLVQDELKEKVAGYLYQNVKRFKHITTGFLGTPLISETLTESGYTDMAYLLLNRKEYPSWLYPVTMDATTIWERWDGIRPDSTFQDPNMNSFNHYAYGAIGKWLYSVVAGIQIDEENPGYKNIIIDPHPGEGLTHARAALKTMYGMVSSFWEIVDDQCFLEVTVPPNSTADVIFPVNRIDLVKLDDELLKEHPDFPGVKVDKGRPVLRIGSGTYRFRMPAFE